MDPKIQRLKEIMTVLNQDVASAKDVAAVVVQIVKVIKDMQVQLKTDISTNSKECESMCKIVESQLIGVEQKLTILLSNKNRETSTYASETLKKAVSDLKKTISDNSSVLEDKWTFVVDGLQRQIDSMKLDPYTIRDLLETLIGDDRLDISAIKGFDKTLEDIKASGKNVRLVGGSNGIQLMVDGAKIGTVKYLNLIGGTNITLTYTQSQGRNDILIDGTGGGTGFTKLTATGTVDGSNTTFTFLQKPLYIIADGAWYQENKGWTWSGLTATMSVPPQTDIYGFV